MTTANESANNPSVDQRIISVLSEGHVVTVDQLTALLNVQRPGEKKLLAARHVAPAAIRLTRTRQITAVLSHGQTYYSIPTPRHDPKTKNTDDLFVYLRDGHMRALNHLDEYMRALYVKAAADAEWYTLNAAMNVPAMREIYDTPRIAERVRLLAQQMIAGPTSGAD
jgi:hypothetical protein